MTPEDKDRLLAQLKIDEGYRKSAYSDSMGYWTIGYGRLIDARKFAGLTMAEAEQLLKNDVSAVVDKLSDFDWYTCQDSVRQAALANMAFNLGAEGLLHFPHFLAAMAAKDYPKAAVELANSLWHRQVGIRADRIIKQVESGTWSS